MTDVTYTFRVDRALKEAFVAMAEEQDLSAAQVLRRMMRDALEEYRQGLAHERWQKSQIIIAMDEADNAEMPRLASEGVEDEWERQKAGIRRDGGE